MSWHVDALAARRGFRYRWLVLRIMTMAYVLVYFRGRRFLPPTHGRQHA